MTFRFAIAALAASAGTASANIRITEYLYQGLNGSTQVTFEYIELTNLSAAPIDMTGWSFDDDGRVVGATSLSVLGTVAPGESVVITEAADAAFRARWNLGAGVKLFAGNANNLGRNDEINIWDAGGALVDRLTYGDQNFPLTPRANGVSAWRFRSADSGPYGNIDSTWTLSAVGDAQNSYAAVSPGSDIGSPGTYVVPAPAALSLLAFGTIVGARRRAR